MSSDVNEEEGENTRESHISNSSTISQAVEWDPEKRDDDGSDGFPENGEDEDTITDLTDQEFVINRQTSDIGLQTECSTAEVAINTIDGYEEHMNHVMAERAVLRERCQEILDKQIQAEKQQQLRMRGLQQQKEECMKRYQETLGQIQEVTTKLEENRRRTEKERREAGTREQEMKREYNRLEETGRRLRQEEEQEKNKVVVLIAEQAEERESWQIELAELRQKQAELNMTTQEEIARAMAAEVSTLECQRELAMTRIEEWLRAAEQYLSGLRLAPTSVELLQLKHEWDTQIGRVRMEVTSMQNLFNSQIQLVRNGNKLDSLPSIIEPVLWPVPRPPSPVAPKQTFQNTAPQQASSKLEILLEKLSSRFPGHTRDQLTALLHQIKKDRGTLAGLSVEELTHQVAQRVAESDQQNRGPTTFPPSYFSTAAFRSQPPRVPAGASRKLCLMCQNAVQPGDLHPLSCSHIVHKECIKVWVQSSRNSGCPFCPSKA
ncbi:RING finger protein 214 [Erpetoichthys calabaricus]|uniref:Ring finger protein 214 n=1 Tax=Erpetoichthys calabaricus TaxID=27687 RepID=A0A8C4SP33_ERPCA|nr:RING finger protein 214 [Erpetoichthys calabaricus]